MFKTINLPKYIDNTFLKPASKEELIYKFMDTFKFGFRGLCIPTNYLRWAIEAKKLFPSSPTKIIVVDNFPLGFRHFRSMNTLDIAKGVNRGIIDEVDVVLPLFYIKANGFNKYVEMFLEVYYALGIPVKWIIEEPYWKWGEIEKLVKNIYDHWKEFGNNVPVYIKSNTGFVTRKRELGEVAINLTIIVLAVSENNFKVKISGGVKCPFAVEQIARLGGIVGTSSGLEILEKYHEQK